MPAQLDRQQKHSTQFVGSFTNPTVVGCEVIDLNLNYPWQINMT